MVVAMRSSPFERYFFRLRLNSWVPAKCVLTEPPNMESNLMPANTLVAAPTVASTVNDSADSNFAPVKFEMTTPPLWLALIPGARLALEPRKLDREIGRASCRERGCREVWMWGGGVK